MDTDLERAGYDKQLRRRLAGRTVYPNPGDGCSKANNLDLGNEGMSIAIGNIFGDMALKKMKKKSQSQGRVEDPEKKLSAESDRYGSGDG